MFLFSCLENVAREELNQLVLSISVAVRFCAPGVGVHNPSLRTFVYVGKEV